VIGFMIVGNPFPVVEHPFITNEKGQVVMDKQKDSNGKIFTNEKLMRKVTLENL